MKDRPEIVGFENVAKYLTSELACIVEMERYRAKVGGGEDISPVTLRVTSVLRPEDGRLVGGHKEGEERYGNCGVDAGNQLDEADHALALEFEGYHDLFLTATAGTRGIAEVGRDPPPFRRDAFVVAGAGAVYPARRGVGAGDAEVQG